jgi:hypothetical protein
VLLLLYCCAIHGGSPVRQVRALGDRVRYDDEIVLESVARKGQFCHTAASSMGEWCAREGRPDWHTPQAVEVSIAVNKAVFVAGFFRQYARYQPRRPALGSLEGLIVNREGQKARQPNLGEIPLAAGSVVQLFHKDSVSYLSAEGAFDDLQSPERANPWVVHDVHLRTRTADPARPHRLRPPTSAVSYFVLEKSTPSTGGVVEWGQPIRFRHLCTNMLLALVPAPRAPPDLPNPTAGSKGDSYHLRLVKAADVSSGAVRKSDTLFRMSPVIQATEFIPSNVYTRIQHVATETWLSSTDTKLAARGHAFSPTGSGLVDLQEQQLSWSEEQQNWIQNGTTLVTDSSYATAKILNAVGGPPRSTSSCVVAGRFRISFPF